MLFGPRNVTLHEPKKCTRVTACDSCTYTPRMKIPLVASMGNLSNVHVRISGFPHKHSRRTPSFVVVPTRELQRIRYWSKQKMWNHTLNSAGLQNGSPIRIASRLRDDVGLLNSDRISVSVDLQKQQLFFNACAGCNNYSYYYHNYQRYHYRCCSCYQYRQ